MLLSTLLVVSLVSLSLPGDGLAASVSYGDLGSFTYGSGCHHSKPESPSAIVIKYWLYTKSKNWAYRLDRTDDSSITGSSFSSSKQTKFIIHGYTDEYSSSWFQDMRKALVAKDTNVIMVDWKVGGGRANYAQSRANTRVVGRDIARMMEKLKSKKGASYSEMHVIGHSLGAHTAGYCGQWLKSEMGSYPGRISGLDPAGPEFMGCANSEKLDKTDATFVDNIHTDGELTGAGLLEQLGYQDFYPNGGESQPGCQGTSIVEACDHMRAVYLFTDSISASCSYNPTKKCSNWSSYPNCNSCGTCPEMGYNALKSRGSGAFYLTTGSSKSYCN